MPTEDKNSQAFQYSYCNTVALTFGTSNFTHEVKFLKLVVRVNEALTTKTRLPHPLIGRRKTLVSLLQIFRFAQVY